MIALQPGRLLLVFQRKSNECRFEFPRPAQSCLSWIVKTSEEWHNRAIENGCVLLHWYILLCKASTVATFVGKMGVACSDIVPECFIFAKGYHHSAFANVFSWIRKSWRKFSFADYSRYTVYASCWLEPKTS